MVIRRFLSSLFLALALIFNATLVYAQSSALREAQQHLTELGYAPGQADGYTGPSTTSAISAFQRDNGLEVTGSLDDLTLRVIRDSVINQTLFGGNVPLVVQRPEPEIVPLNRDGSKPLAAGPTSNGLVAQPSIVPLPAEPTKEAVTDDPVEAASNSDSSTEPVEQPDSSLVDSPSPMSISDLLDQIGEPSELPNRLESDSDPAITAVTPEDRLPDVASTATNDDLSKDLPEVEYSAPGETAEADKVAVVPADQAEDLSPLSSSDTVNDLSPVVPNVDAMPEMPELSVAPSNSDLGTGAAVAAETFGSEGFFGWLQDRIYWIVVPVLVLLLWLVWRLISYLIGASEPKRMAMTRAEFLGSADMAAKTRSSAEESTASTPQHDDVGAVPASAQHGLQPKRAAANIANTADYQWLGPTEVRSGKPATHPGRLVEAESASPEVHPVPVSQSGSDRSTVIRDDRRPDARRSVGQEPVAGRESVSPGTPRIIRSANNQNALTSDQLNTRATSNDRQTAIDVAEIRARRSRDAQMARGNGASGRVGASDGRIVRPARPRREGV